MGLSRRRNSAELATLQSAVLFPIRFERWPAFAPMESCLEYRSVKICGKQCPALVDNQSSLNMMSLAFVKKTGLVLHLDNTAFRLTDGSICHAVGRVRTRCKLVRPCQAGQKSITHQEFYVLQNAFAPLVLGLPFLRAAGLLLGSYLNNISPQTTSSEELVETQSIHYSTYTTLCLKVLLSHKFLTHEAIAIPDNGADLNLISLDYAKAVGFSLNEASKAELPLTIGNGRTVFTLGKIYTTIQLNHNTPLSSRIPITFFVVKGLVADLVLGRHFSKKNQLFEEYQPHLQWILIEWDIPGILATESGLKYKELTPKSAANITVSKGQSNINNDPNRWGELDDLQAPVPAPIPPSRDSNIAGTQVQHGDHKRPVTPNHAEQRGANGEDAEDHPQQQPEGAKPQYLAPNIPAPNRTNRIPVEPTSTNSDENSHNSSSRAGQNSSPGTTPNSDTLFEEKHGFLSKIGSRLHFRKAVKPI